MILQADRPAINCSSMSTFTRSKPYVGRFAPSPTGRLHFGSLLAAVASYLQAQQCQGKWLLRIEDIDPPREVTGSAEAILSDLATLGMNAAEPVLFQSRRFNAYQQSCEQLIQAGLAYWCGCSRRELPQTGVYPGTCSNGLAPGKTPRALRVRVCNIPITFVDKIHGEQVDDMQSSIGDFVIKRADGVYAYQLAVVVDDAFQKVTEVVRGTDLLDSTARQVWLQKCLGLPTPDYVHIPTAILPDGSKLSKSLGSDPINRLSAAKALRAALNFLGHAPPAGDLARTWKWAIENWSIDRISRDRDKIVELQNLAGP